MPTIYSELFENLPDTIIGTAAIRIHLKLQAVGSLTPMQILMAFGRPLISIILARNPLPIRVIAIWRMKPIMSAFRFARLPLIRQLPTPMTNTETRTAQPQ
jgi:hypothetical protein